MQAKTEARMAEHAEWMAEHDERMAEHDKRMVKVDERMDKFDKRLEATRKLVETGIKLVTKLHQDNRALARQIAAVGDQTRKTSRDLDRLINSWNKGPSNGHRPRG